MSFAGKIEDERPFPVQKRPTPRRKSGVNDEEGKAFRELHQMWKFELIWHILVV